jgi:hypothetical protein
MPDIKTGRHIQDYSLELLDGTAVVTADDRNEVLATIISRLYHGLQERFQFPEMAGLQLHDPGRKAAIRVSVQFVDEGASDSDIRRLARIDLAAYDEFVERERPKLLSRKSSGPAQ